MVKVTRGWQGEIWRPPWKPVGGAEEANESLWSCWIATICIFCFWCKHAYFLSPTSLSRWAFHLKRPPSWKVSWQLKQNEAFGSSLISSFIMTGSQGRFLSAQSVYFCKEQEKIDKNALGTTHLTVCAAKKKNHHEYLFFLFFIYLSKNTHFLEDFFFVFYLKF